MVTMTDVSGMNISLSGTYNTSQCLTITSDLSPDVCVVAVNTAGTSSETLHFIITEYVVSPRNTLRRYYNMMLLSMQVTGYCKMLVFVQF